MVELGHKAPVFELEDDQGEIFRLAEHTGVKMLLVFYPGDDTPVCTAQLCDYRDGIESFDGLGVSVVGISGDDVGCVWQQQDVIIGQTNEPEGVVG